MQVFLDLTKSGGNCMKRISLERDRRLMLSVDLPVQQILETRAKEHVTNIQEHRKSMISVGLPL